MLAAFVVVGTSLILTLLCSVVILPPPGSTLPKRAVRLPHGRAASKDEE